MASNNQRTPSAPPPPRWSNGNKKNSKEHQQMILGQVKEMFDSILEPDIILSVVQNCKWKLQPSIDALIMLSENADIPANQNNQNLGNQTTASFNFAKKQNKDAQTKSQNVDKMQHKSNAEQDTSFLNLNDKELQRQQEEFRKFERLKKDLTQKGFGSSNENMSKFNHPIENKISPSKLQQFSQNWFNPQGSTSKDDMIKGINSQINTECNPRGFMAQNSQLGQPNFSRKGSKQQNDNLGQPEFNQKVTNPQNENLFGSKLQFSRDMPNKLYDKGTIPKNSQGLPKNPVNVQSQQNLSQLQKNLDQTGRNRQNSPTKPKNFYLKGPNSNVNTQYTQNSLQGLTMKEPTPRNFHFNQCSSNSSISAEFNPNRFNQEFSQMPKRDYSPQQVAQFNANYGNQNNFGTNTKPNTHKGETESLCGLKVQYRFPGLENSSDDDADVVIEEEMTDYHIQIPPLMSVNVCQFLSSSTQSPPKNTYPELRMIHTPSPPRSPQRSIYDITFKRIISTILEGSKILILIRGVPGSGKSYLAKSIIHSSVGGDPTSFIFSTDDFFVMIGRGVYQHDVSRLQEAHSFNQKKVFAAIKEGRSPVIVDNTNTQVWEMLPYASMAVKQGYIIEVLEPNTPWAQNVNELAKKNSHCVPKDKIKQMIERYERDFTGAKLLQQFSLRYDPRNMPPQPRAVPALDNTIECQEIVPENEKPKSKRRKSRRKKNTNFNGDNTNVSQSSDQLDYLLTSIDQNVKPIGSPEETSSSETTLDKDLSNTGISDSDAQNKSLVDYSIETDSADDGDVNKGNSLDESKLEEKEIFELLEPNVANETISSLEESTLLVDPAILHAVAMTKQNLDSFDNELSTSLKSDMTQGSEDILNMLQLNLGAIGSERKGSLTVTECEGPMAEKVDSQDNNENVLSQCWDFTLLLNGTQIHSVGPTDLAKMSRRNSMDDSQRHNSETNTEIDNFLIDHGKQFYGSDYCKSEDTVQSRGTSSQDNHQSGNNEINDDLSKEHLSTDSQIFNKETTKNECNEDITFDYSTTRLNQENIMVDDYSVTTYHDFSFEENSNEKTLDENYYSVIEATELEDADSVMARIINKMDDLEIEKNVLCDTHASSVNPQNKKHSSVSLENTSDDNHLRTVLKPDKKVSDVERILREADEKLSQDLEADRILVQERGTIGSIFSMIKNSLLGGQSDRKPVQANEHVSTSTKNAIKPGLLSSENESHETVSSIHTANDFEDVSIKIDEDSTFESSLQLSSTTVGDTLTEKLSNTTYIDDSSNKTNLINDIPRKISNPVICDTLDFNASNSLINDTLSEKLLSNVTTNKAIEFFNSWANMKTVSHGRKSKSVNDFEYKMQDITENYEDANSKTDSDNEVTDYCESNKHANSVKSSDYNCLKTTSERRDIPLTSTSAMSESSVDTIQYERDSQENKLSAKSSSTNLNMFSEMNVSEISDAGLSDIIEETLNETWFTISSKNENLHGIQNSKFRSVSEIDIANDSTTDLNLEQSLQETKLDTFIHGIDNKEHNDWIGNLNSDITMNDAIVMTSQSDIEKNTCTNSNSIGHFNSSMTVGDIDKLASLSDMISNVDSIAEIDKISYPSSNKDILTVIQNKDELTDKNIELPSCEKFTDKENIADLTDLPNDSIKEESKQLEQNFDLSNPGCSIIPIIVETPTEFPDEQNKESANNLASLNTALNVDEQDKVLEFPIVSENNQSNVIESDNTKILKDNRIYSTMSNAIQCDVERTDSDMINAIKLLLNENNSDTADYNSAEIEQTVVEGRTIFEDGTKEALSSSLELDARNSTYNEQTTEFSIQQEISSCDDEQSETVNLRDIKNDDGEGMKNSDSQTHDLEVKSTEESEFKVGDCEKMDTKCLKTHSNFHNYDSTDARNLCSVVLTCPETEIENVAKVKNLSHTGNNGIDITNSETHTGEGSVSVCNNNSTINALPVINTNNEAIDNMNQVTWKLSPFPVDQIATPDEDDGTIVSKSESSTNTSYYDFNVLYVGGTSEPEYKIVTAFNRCINEGLPFEQMKKSPLKLMLDKSSMTSEVDILSGEASPDIQAANENEKHIKELTEMFPNVSMEDLMEIYENLCNSDFNWAVDVLLEGVPEHVTKYPKIDPPKIVLDRYATPSTSSESNDSENQCQWQNASPQNKKREKLKEQSSSSESNDSEANWQTQSFGAKKKKYKNKVSETALELKRQIEEKMKINEACYNPHILRVKRWKNGEPDVIVDDTVDMPIPNKDVVEFVQPADVPTDIHQSELCDATSSSKVSESTDDFTEEDIEPEEMMELKLGEDFIQVLENEFGNSEFQFPGGLFPVIQIKKSMAQQLYALWIESVQQQLDAQQEQLDKMIEKDAEYARSLEQEEARVVTEPEVPNFQEIMDMEMALAIYNNDMKEQLKRETPNDMASRLTRQMLHETFPQFDPETLNEILNAHNGIFKETVDILEASTGHVVNKTDTLKKQKNLIDRAKKESIQPDEQDRSPTHISPLVVVNPELSHSSNSSPAKLTYDSALEEAQTSRKEAHRHLLLRNENFAKATEAYRKGNPEVAAYYSHMAKLHSKKMELANSTAASAFLAAQDYVMDKQNTLDLHYLYVPEALQALDVFLEYHFARLSEENKKTMNLYIITGRGARSAKGQSRIKPAVSRRLAAKNIRFMDDNPGCLKVVIHRKMG